MPEASLSHVPGRQNFIFEASVMPERKESAKKARTAPEAAPVQVEPYFDLESFMTMCHETRMPGPMYEKLTSSWDAWQSGLRVFTVGGERGWLAVWLPEEVEREVDETWAKSPSEGFLLNNLAQFLCMTVVAGFLPQVEDGGCAPQPVPDMALANALGKEGLELDGACRPGRRYAVLTYHPFRGGCEVCNLNAECPKGSGGSAMTLPGYER